MFTSAKRFLLRLTDQLYLRISLLALRSLSSDPLKQVWVTSSAN